MTIITISQTSSQLISTNTRRSDMQKRGAVRNLFGTTVDREELQMNIRQLKSENDLAISGYEIDSVIDVIHSAREDQARRLKRLPRQLERDDEETSSSEDEEEERPITANTSDANNSSSDNATGSSIPPICSKRSGVKLVKHNAPLQQKIIPGTPNNMNEHVFFLFVPSSFARFPLQLSFFFFGLHLLLWTLCNQSHFIWRIPLRDPLHVSLRIANLSVALNPSLKSKFYRFFQPFFVQKHLNSVHNACKSSVLMCQWTFDSLVFIASFVDSFFYERTLVTRKLPLPN